MSDRISRREFIKGSLGVAGALSAPSIINFLGKSSPSPDKEFLEIRDGNFYLGGEEYMIKGANYLTRDYPWRMFHKYDSDQIDKELDMAVEIGINTIRVSIMHPYSIGKTKENWKPYHNLDIREDYFARFNDFLSLAENHDIKVLVNVMSYAPHAWFEPKNHHYAKKYLEKWLPDFADDERIIAWDAKNEPEIHQAYFDRQGEGNKYDIPGFAKETAEAIKELDQNHPVTIGLNDTHAEEGEVEEHLIGAISDYINHEDFYSFHFYVPIKHFNPAVEKIRKHTDKPVLLEEYGLPTKGVSYGSKERQKWYFQEVLERVNQNGLEGAMVWELTDHPERLSSLDVPWGQAYDNPEFRETTLHHGIFEVDYSKKPAAHVVEQYYKWIL